MSKSCKVLNQSFTLPDLMKQLCDQQLLYVCDLVVDACTSVSCITSAPYRTGEEKAS
jgi:hypothetical protein